MHAPSPFSLATTALALMFCVQPAVAGEDIELEIVGQAGTPGASGTSGIDPTDGEDGGDGESVAPDPIAGTPYPGEFSFDALIIAGDGGDGGNGGDATDPEVVAGAGGDGGDGGSLTTDIAFGGSARTGRAALDGYSGDGGNGGDAGDGAPAVGGDGGNGGDIHAVGSGVADYELSSGLIQRFTAGNGGHGGTGSVGGAGGRGGDIRFDAELRNVGSGEVTLGFALQAGNGGNGGDGASGGSGGSVLIERLAVDTAAAPAFAKDPGRGVSLLEIGGSAAGGDGGAATNGRAGDGGDVFVMEATTDEVTRFSADVWLELTGGSGGDAHGNGRAGYGGSVTIGQAAATNGGEGDVFIFLDAAGGDGGNGFGEAAAGDGASVMLDHVSRAGEARFGFFLNSVQGGAAGSVESGAAGRAGDATIRDTMVGAYDDAGVELSASGGAGSNRSSDNGVAGNGGSAIAESVAVTTGQRAFAGASATGGRGGAGTLGARDGTGGSAVAAAHAQAAGWAIANAGAATSRGGPGTSVAVAAAVALETDWTATAAASARFGDIADAPPPMLDTAWARLTALPDVAQVAALIEASPDVSVNFDTGGASDLFAYSNVGIGFQSGEALETYTATLDAAIAIDQLAVAQNLLVGFLNAEASGDDFGDFLITLSVGSDVLVSQQGSNSAEVSSILDGRTYDLGSVVALADPDGMLELEIAVMLTGAAAGEGIRFEVLIGNSTLGIGAPVPLPGALWLLMSGGAALFARPLRARQKR